MIIEQVEALKSWLTSKLSPICDAEPSALAKYVCALVKKDKPEQDLRDICLDQLDVFLQLKTKSFVDELFEALQTKSYIPPADKKAVPVHPAPVKHDGLSASHQGEKEKEETNRKKASEISSTTEDKENKDTSKDVKEKEATSATINSSREPVREIREPRALSREGKDRDGDRDRRDSWKDERNKDGIRDARDIIRERERDGVKDRDTREVREPRDRDHRERDRDFRRRRTRSRSFSPRRRDFDDRIRRRYDDRPRHSPDRRWGRRRSWSRSPRRRSPFDRPLGRLRSRSPRVRSRSPRLRSKSPRDRFRPFRSRTRTRSRSPGPRSWSRPGSGSGGRLRSPSNSGARQPDSRGSTPVQDNDYSTLISSSTNDLPAITSTVGLRPAGEEKSDGRIVSERHLPMGQGSRTRCINFEEKGYCILGDMCLYDHGINPVVVEDVPITNVVSGGRPLTGPTNTGPGFVPPDLRIPPPIHMGMRMSIRQPPPNLVEPYMPEAPGLRGPLRPPFMRGMGPHMRPPPPGIIMSTRPQMFPPQREVIMGPLPVPDSDDLDTLITDKEPSRIVLPSKRPYSVIGVEPVDPHLGPTPPRMAHMNQNHHMFTPTANPQFQARPNIPKRGFDYNRLGGGFRQAAKPAFKTGNLTLEVRKIPTEMNNIAKINEHFGKFGNLTNIQVKFQGDPGAALISFSNNGEATAAYKSPEPVFNNRFIKLFWHDPDKASHQGEKSGQITEQQNNSGAGHRSGGRVGDGIDHPSLVLPQRNSFPPPQKLQLDNTKAKMSEVPAPSSDSSIGTEQTLVYSSSLGHIKKTVINPAASSPAKIKSGVALTSPSAAKPSDFVLRIEAIKRAEANKKQATVKQAELDAKKHDLLAKQIQQQKLLIETLDRKKGTMSEQERSNLFKALKTISDAIDKVKYSTGTKKPSTFQTPSPSQLRFVSQEQAQAKEMQDLEQEVMTRQKKGEDTTGLRMKLVELANKQQTTAFPYGRGRGWPSSRASTWAARGRGRGAVSAVGRTTLDNRPKTLEVKNFELDEIESIKAHFLQFGELDRVELMEDPLCLWVTFTARGNAEVALAQGTKFSNKILNLKWYEAQRLQQRESIQSSDLDDEDLSVSLGSIEEEALLNFKATDKSTSNDGKDTEVSDITQPVGDSRSVVAQEDVEEATETLTVNYQRSLSEDLILGDEHNFKASYTDDDEDDDHITVTVSNTVNSGSWVYSESSTTLEEEQNIKDEDKDDLDNLANSEITTEDDASSWV